MRLFIAEKPSLARAIAEALPGPRQRRDGYIQCGADDVVAWCAGHVLELAAPDAYDPAFKQWRLEHLPIVPADWRLEVSAPDLLRTIKTLLPKASRVVHAGDPDREGQLLVDEVLVFLGYRGTVDRLLVSDLNPPAVRKALGEMQSNARFRGLYEAALARQRADWLYGINLTRLYTLLGRAGGYDGVLSVGRVQTPLLGLIVRRDREIEAFKSKPYFVVQVEARARPSAFKATWTPSEGASAIVDEVGRLISREHAQNLRTRLEGKAGVVASCAVERKAEPPPLPYSLPALQIDAGAQLGLGPKQTLDACQALYETHRLLTYPRSDCQHLPSGQHGQVASVLSAIAANAPKLAATVARADRGRRSRAWNDEKVTAHHAIIPTPVSVPIGALSAAEGRVYELVARRYVAQFLPAFEFNETKLELEVDGEHLAATGHQVLSAGWRDVVSDGPDEGAERRVEDGETRQALPLLERGASVVLETVSIIERKTTPPKLFSEASLIQAMTGIARFVDDPRIKKLLREADGIGTPATQAQIIETLFERRFIERQGRSVRSTTIGRALTDALPVVATVPDLTALWESAMRRISEGQMSLTSFTDAVTTQLTQLVSDGKARGLKGGVLPSSASAVRASRRRRRPARRPTGSTP
jgi:DNA topoisomerase-3